MIRHTAGNCVPVTVHIFSRHFWTAATPGSRIPANDQQLAGDVGRIVAQGTWMVLEIADERNLGPVASEKMKGRMTPVLSTLKGRPVATMSMDEKFELTFEKVPDYLGDSLAEIYRARVSPAAIGTAIATLTVLSIVSDGVIAAALVAIGYAMVGADIFSIIGDLVMAVSLVANASDEREIDRAAQVFAKVAVEITLNVLVTILTLGAGRVGAKFGKTTHSTPGNNPQTLEHNSSSLSGLEKNKIDRDQYSDSRQDIHQKEGFQNGHLLQKTEKTKIEKPHNSKHLNSKFIQKTTPLKKQKQAGHIKGTAQNLNRQKSNKSTSTFFGKKAETG